MTYRNNTSNALSITKKGKNISDISPAELHGGVLLNEKKKKDVETLLTIHFGKEWPDLPKLAFYKNILQSNSAEDTLSDESDEDESGPTCEFLEEISPI